MTTPYTILGYAEPATGRRPWCRTAVSALACVLVYPVVVAVPLLYAADNNGLPQHFLCCNHPEVTALALVVAPLIGAAWGGVAMVRIAGDMRRPRPRGASAAALAIVLGCTCSILGMLLFFAFKA